jgi:hypothetical protein
MRYILNLRRDMKTLLERLANVYQDFKKDVVTGRNKIQGASEEGDLSQEKSKTNSGATCDRIQGARREEGGSREAKPKPGSEFLCAHDCIEIL